MSENRQGKTLDAAESFAASTQGRLPAAEYDLHARYYLARSLEELDEPEKAAQPAAKDSLIVAES